MNITKSQSKHLSIRQLDKRLSELKHFHSQSFPPKGWVNLIRLTLKMSLRQLGERLGVTSQGVKDIERREAKGSITINGLREVGDALDLQLVYGFVSKGISLEKMIEKRAEEIARRIVMRTSTTMKLEDQENSQERLEEAIAEMKEELKRNLPRTLWD